MATLYGQNLRVINGSSVIAKATNCVITMTNNTSDLSTKDDTGSFANPGILKKSWQIQVDAMTVSDMGTLLSSIKAKTPVQLIWDETEGEHNATGVGEEYARSGHAYITDATFSMNDREFSTKSVTFTGTGGLTNVAGSTGAYYVPPYSFTRGEFIRLYLSQDNEETPALVIGAAKSLQFHVSCQVEESTTKDTYGDYVVNEITGISYNIQSSALVKSSDIITSSVGAIDLEESMTIWEGMSPVKWTIANASDKNNRTKGTVIVCGSAIISQLQINAQNTSKATFSINLDGVGEYKFSESS